MANAASPSACIVVRPGTALTVRSDRNQTLTVAEAAGRSLWMTRMGERMDYLFRAGDSVVLRPGDDITLGVHKWDGAACVVLCALAEPAPRLSRTRAWLAAIRGALRHAAAGAAASDTPR
ncbi:DUF2917 domain-containing protein [Noviherbaspirillum autotrophicum]|uniref:DUF2917 domain-containing protein n=1 Tax=Noviherbaspirillum autotrophicum TaxID=709839 RepID=UPI0005893EB2|nr:DUF2917 domain-containing protein [Noviherbaspirillum autotrophicum]